MSAPAFNNWPGRPAEPTHTMIAIDELATLRRAVRRMAVITARAVADVNAAG